MNENISLFSEFFEVKSSAKNSENNEIFSEANPSVRNHKSTGNGIPSTLAKNLMNTAGECASLVLPEIPMEPLPKAALPSGMLLNPDVLSSTLSPTVAAGALVQSKCDHSDICRSRANSDIIKRCGSPDVCNSLFSEELKTGMDTHDMAESCGTFVQCSGFGPLLSDGAMKSLVVESSIMFSIAEVDNLLPGHKNLMMEKYTPKAEFKFRSRSTSNQGLPVFDTPWAMETAIADLTDLPSLCSPVLNIMNDRMDPIAANSANTSNVSETLTSNVAFNSILPCLSAGLDLPSSMRKNTSAISSPQVLTELNPPTPIFNFPFFNSGANPSVMPDDPESDDYADGTPTELSLSMCDADLCYVDVANKDSFYEDDCESFGESFCVLKPEGNKPENFGQVFESYDDSIYSVPIHNPAADVTHSSTSQNHSEHNNT